MKCETPVMADDDLELAIGARIKELRIARGLTLDELADASSVSRAMISRIERAEASPTASLLSRLCAALGLSLSAFFTEEDEEISPLARREQQAIWRDPGTGYVRRAVSPPGTGSKVDVVEVVFPAGARVIFRPHPLSAGHRQQAGMIARIDALLAAASTPQCPHLTSSRALRESIIGNFNRSDALVTDVSSVASDYLASCKPMAVVLPIGTWRLADAEEYPVLRATYLIDLGEDDLASGLAPLVGAAPDPLGPVRQELRSYYLGDERDSVRLFLDAAASVLRDTPETATTSG